MKNKSTFTVIFAAALYAINIPFSKLLLNYVSPTMLAALLYIGSGIGMLIYGGASRASKKYVPAEALTIRELPYVAAMVALDIIAPILLMFGIEKTTSANAMLLNNFETVATSVIAYVIFKEAISRKLCLSVCLVTLASIILSFEGKGAFSFNTGSFLVIGACICWGLENNCTKVISNKSSKEIVIIKGIFSGLGCLIIALATGEQIPQTIWIIAAMLLGFVAYGLSIDFYIMAQQSLGAAKTSAYYSTAPFFGIIFSIVFVGERPKIQFYIALIIIIISTALMVKDTIELQRTQ